MFYYFQIVNDVFGSGVLMLLSEPAKTLAADAHPLPVGQSGNNQPATVPAWDRRWG